MDLKTACECVNLGTEFNIFAEYHFLLRSFKFSLQKFISARILEILE